MATQEMSFTKGALDKAAHAGGAATRYRDARYPNLYLEVGTRSKTWRYRKFWKGRNFTETLGTWPQMTVIEAAQTAAEINTQVEDAGMLHEQSVDHTAVQMTGGQEWRRSGRYVNASKTLMIENLAVLFAAGDLKFAHDLPLRKEIEEDLASFTTQTTAAGNQIITQSRNASGHGDAGIALIVAAFASQYLTPQNIQVGRLVGMY
jgi:hypothetical protein